MLLNQDINSYLEFVLVPFDCKNCLETKKIFCITFYNLDDDLN